MASRAALARELRGEPEAAAQRRFSREFYTEAPDVTADFETVTADQLGQRAVDRVRALPSHGTGPPPANALNALIEGERREDIDAARRKRVCVRRAEAERLQPGRERLAIARVLPGRPAVP